MRILNHLLAGLIVALLSGCTVASQDAPRPQAADQPTNAPTPSPSAPMASSDLLPSQSPPASLLRSEWRTDFTRRTVEWSEIRSGGPPKDGIPAIDAPTFESVEVASTWLSPRDPVIVFAVDDDVRAYPLAILIWHEIVNDVVGPTPVAVTYCPLCNASIVFDRRFADAVLDFGTTGLLRNSDLVMYDRQTESWWQQFTGQGIAGQWAGEQLTFLSSQVISFADFAAQFPDAQVLARPELARSYGANPYVSYDTSSRPFLFDGELDNRLAPTARVMGIAAPELQRAYPFRTIAEVGAIHDDFGDVPIVIWHKSGTASALDTRSIAEGRDVGSAAVFDRRIGDRVLTFSRQEDGTFTDEETGSKWNVLGFATEGELAGNRLAAMIAFDHLWFAWAAFYPDTQVFTLE